MTKKKQSNKSEGSKKTLPARTVKSPAKKGVISRSEIKKAVRSVSTIRKKK